MLDLVLNVSFLLSLLVNVNGILYIFLLVLLVKLKL